MTGLIVVAVATVLVLAFGYYRKMVDGKVRTPSSAAGTAQGPFTVLQFSSEFCAPCRRARAALADLIRNGASVKHVEVDVADDPSLVSQYQVTRTPTILVLDAECVVHHRVVGELRPMEFARALTDLGALEPVNR